MRSSRKLIAALLAGAVVIAACGGDDDDDSADDGATTEAPGTDASGTEPAGTEASGTEPAGTEASGTEAPAGTGGGDAAPGIEAARANVEQYQRSGPADRHHHPARRPGRAEEVRLPPVRARVVHARRGRGQGRHGGDRLGVDPDQLGERQPGPGVPAGDRRRRRLHRQHGRGPLPLRGAGPGRSRRRDQDPQLLRHRAARRRRDQHLHPVRRRVVRREDRSADGQLGDRRLRGYGEHPDRQHPRLPGAQGSDRRLHRRAREELPGLRVHRAGHHDPAARRW